MTKVKVAAGACGFTSVIKAEKIGKMRVKVTIISACQDVRNMNEELADIDCSKGVFVKITDSLIYKLAGKKLRDTDCPVPCAIIKAIQVELGGAIAKDVTMKIQRDV
ncbi:MAG TPA: hypothetical protein DEF34_11160 [Desulfotomaculum sp.]|nr:hypothetical protein [Desulfotomaculum sp.]